MEAIRQVVSSEMVITVVGVGLPHMEFGLFEQSNEDYFLFIGGDIERKNLNFLLAFWGHIYETTRYKLVVVVGKNSASLRTTPLHKMDGVKYILEPDNLALSILYQGSRALLWPSMAEGFGIPLLEAMSFGRPFVSTPVGAANELRTGESVVLPPDKLLWQNQIIEMVLNPQNDSAEQIKKTYEYTWDEVSYRIKKEIGFFLN
jgi:glycosyltransferase involved in cell wall biosynthesis